MRTFGFLLLCLIALLSGVSFLSGVMSGTSAIHQILTAIWGLTSTVAIAAASILATLPELPPKHGFKSQTRCPHCFELIDRRATKCNHCGGGLKALTQPATDT